MTNELWLKLSTGKKRVIELSYFFFFFVLRRLVSTLLLSPSTFFSGSNSTLLSSVFVDLLVNICPSVWVNFGLSVCLHGMKERERERGEREREKTKLGKIVRTLSVSLSSQTHHGSFTHTSLADDMLSRCHDR